MNREAFSAELERLGITTSEAALVLSRNPRTVRRWKSGKTDIPPVIAMLLPKLTQEECRTLLREPRSTR